MAKQNLLEKVMNEPQPLPRKVPDYMRKKGGIWYWTGAILMITFLYESLTGLILLFYYQPAHPYSSTGTILAMPYGTVLLTTHLYAAYIMIAFLYIHLLRNLFVGAYKKPRQMQWLTGILLLLVTIGVVYFGYSMSGDVLSADATDVGRGIAAGAPLIGSYLRSIFFGSGTSLSLFMRLEGWHIVLAGVILAMFALHFYLAEYNTIMPSPKHAEFKVPAVDNDDPSYKPWYPYNLLYMGQVSFFTLAMIFIIPSVLAILPNVPVLFSPFPQVSVSSPLASSVPAYPPWILLFIYKELDFGISSIIGPFWASLIFIGLPVGYLLFIPYLDRNDSLKLSRRKAVLYTGILGLFYYIGLSVWGAMEPGVPVSNLVGFLFFAVPMLVVIPVSLYMIKKVEAAKSNLGNNLWKLYSILPVIGFLAILVGITSYMFLDGLSYYDLAALIFVLVLLAISSLYAYGWIYGIKENTKNIKMSERGHLVFGGIYGFLAIVIFTMISDIPPTKVEYQALYGIGIGLLFVLGGAFTKLYRSYAYHEG
jgi:quinol-cytochrome oxidoreductase complex cytochrome b subunit